MSDIEPEKTVNWKFMRIAMISYVVATILIIVGIFVFAFGTGAHQAITGFYVWIYASVIYGLVWMVWFIYSLLIKFSLKLLLPLLLLIPFIYLLEILRGEVLYF